MTLTQDHPEARTEGLKEVAVMTGALLWIWFIAFGVVASIYGLPEFFLFAIIPLLGSIFGWYVVRNTPE